jgi:hypothetical protein
MFYNSLDYNNDIDCVNFDNYEYIIYYYDSNNNIIGVEYYF